MFGDDGVRRLDCGGRTLRLDRPRVVGIVNVTPDSFSDGGDHADTGAAVAHGLTLLAEGADMLDIGGESTRPGAADVDTDEEMRRVIPVLRGLAEQCDAPLSVDTSKPAVMRAAVEAGAGLINDVRALREDDALRTAAELDVPVCLMHMQGAPRSMQAAPEYDDVVGEVHRFLAERVFACEMAGLDKRKLLVDPGFGFGKTLEHNLALLRATGRFADLAGGVYVGLSRKTMIGAITGREVPTERVSGSVAAALIAVQRGAMLVRTHDVAATVDALAVWRAVHAGDPPPVAPLERAPRWPDDD
ncbi:MULTISPECIES: dihydropteroate synthase [Oleiagrimonas]|uniref:Dihydropteroate synthase n=1 Tax=Oleiagrimonas citrea TaxID=1665687 RepID=A0A846ZIV3_9GAMM|nr:MULTISPECIES: dihydropteroate synthase [Oleiagrimonas]NKZ37499.1 dihydropteroate synthase [Oleiagrimonas citrea]RAP58087.1 dihydropteroate synthase [Oleiagrimonas sp. MCCC 1A03011]